jgi:uncharacterized protein with HEPN domain
MLLTTSEASSMALRSPNSKPILIDAASWTRSFEIISEASRRLPAELKLDHPEVPWRRVSSIGSILRHVYENIIPDALWKYAQDDLPTPEAVCRTEMKIIQERGIGGQA